jgi:hypothetical protein
LNIRGNQPPAHILDSYHQYSLSTRRIIRHPAPTTLAHGLPTPMSFLSDTVFSGSSTRLHVAGNQPSGGNVIRKSKSHGGFLSPLSQLVRNPVQSLGNAVSSHYNAPFQDALNDASRKQILYLRMKNVGTQARC